MARGERGSVWMAVDGQADGSFATLLSPPLFDFIGPPCLNASR